MKKDVREIERLIEEGRFRTVDEDYQGAIESMEQALKIIKKYPFLGDSYLDSVFWTLGNLYGVTKQYEKAVKIEELEIGNMLKRHRITCLNNARLSEEDASRLISLYLCLGTAYMNLNQSEKARDRYAMGYTLAYVHFGEFDERTLKQAYNIACRELFSGNQTEGIRQLKYCYYDMREHLGENSEYTQKAKSILLQVEENPDELYANHMELRKIVREELSKMWQ